MQIIFTLDKQETLNYYVTVLGAKPKTACSRTAGMFMRESGRHCEKTLREMEGNQMQERSKGNQTISYLYS